MVFSTFLFLIRTKFFFSFSILTEWIICLFFLSSNIAIIKCLTFFFFLYLTEMARDSAVGRERILVVPSSLALDNSTTNQHVTSAQNDLNQQILEVSQSFILFRCVYLYHGRLYLECALKVSNVFVIWSRICFYQVATSMSPHSTMHIKLDVIKTNRNCDESQSMFHNRK